MNYKILLISSLLILFTLKVSAQNKIPSEQDVLNKYGFLEYKIPLDNDTITFYINNSKKLPDKLVLYLQGTSPDPLFSIEKENGIYNSYIWFPSDYKVLDTTYSYVVIGKTGISTFLNDKQDYSKYHQSNSLENRVFQADTVINYISQNLLKSLQKVIVYGHSEGAPVAAKLATVNKKITHLGFWAGNVLPDFYDFILFERKDAWSGKISEQEAHENILETINSFQQIANNPKDVQADYKNDYTNKRWWSYSEPPLNNLLNINIPIFVQVATNDESAPIESSFILPLEFIRNGKTNLTFEVCIECDHGFQIEKENGEFVNKWPDVFNKFIDWTNK